MTEYFSVVIEKETNGTYASHLAALKTIGLPTEARAEVLLLRRTDTNARTGRERLEFAGLGALLGRKTSARKAQTSRRYGRKGGRPRKGHRVTAW